MSNITFKSILFLLLFQSFYVRTQETDVPTNPQQLLMSLHMLFDRVMQKAVSSKDSEDLVNSWNKQDLYEEMRADIMSLNRKRYIQKLKNLKNSQDQQLYELLQDLYKELLYYDRVLQGHYPSGTHSRQESLQHKAQVQKLLLMYESYIEKISSKINAFMYKHIDEVHKDAIKKDKQQMSAVKHAKQAAKPVEVVTSVEQVAPKISKQKPQESQQIQEPKKKEESHQKVFDALQDYIQVFPSEHEEKAVKFMQSIGDLYPDASTLPTANIPSNPQEEDEWLHSKGHYEGQGFDHYKHTVLKNYRPFAFELEDMHEMLYGVYDKIPSLQPNDLQRMAHDANYVAVSNRIQKYKQLVEQASDIIQKKYHHNIDVHQTPILDPLNLIHYKDQHDDMKKWLYDNVHNPIIKNEHVVDKINRKITQHQKK